MRFIVIDEIHEYRGYFGTHFALLLRRLLHKLNTLGAHPQLFLTSATCANPLEHAQKLTGRSEFTLIQSKNQLRPERHFIFVNPITIPDYKFFNIFHLRIANAALACLSQGLATLVFCPTRRFAEEVAKQARKLAEQQGLPSDVIVPYRSGYTSEERREIESGLRSGKYRLVFSTNALELGIDIGKLDVCLLAGFPDNVMSAWQRIGRAGRKIDQNAYVLFYAMNNAVDQFYVSNIDSFLNKPLDQLAVNVENEELVKDHIPYLLYESQWQLKNGAPEILGNNFFARARQQMKEVRPPKKPRKPSYQRLNLRGSSNTVYKLIYKDREIGTISDAQAFREAYVGAVYHHMGLSYRVDSWGGEEINLKEVDPRLVTNPSIYVVPNEPEVFKGLRYGDLVSVYYGRIAIYENLAKYTLEDEQGNILDEAYPNLARRRTGHAFWLELEDIQSLSVDLVRNGLGALEQFLRLGTMFLIPCDRYDTNTFRKDNTIYLYETVNGGIGIANKVFDVWHAVIQEGRKIADNRSCQDGCPKCIYPPRLRDVNGMSKLAGIELANILLGRIGKPTEGFDNELYAWRPIFPK